MTEFFSGMDIRKVNLYRGNSHGCDGIPERDARMGISGSIDHNGICLSLGLLEPANQFALHIRLPEVDLHAQLGCSFPYLGFNVCQRKTTVSFWLPLPKQIQIRSIEKEDLHSAGTLGIGPSFVDWFPIRRAKQPAGQEKHCPGGGWNIEAKLDEALDAKPKQSQPDSEAPIDHWRAAAVEKPKH